MLSRHQRATPLARAAARLPNDPVGVFQPSLLRHPQLRCPHPPGLATSPVREAAARPNRTNGSSTQQSGFPAPIGYVADDTFSRRSALPLTPILA